MDCDMCEFNNNCEDKAKALWTYGDGGDIVGCNLGRPDKEKINSKIKYLQDLLEREGKE